MFFDQDIRGNRLPPGTLCLTYDDGPGPETATLGRFLGEQGIPATFFIVGSHAAANRAVLGELQACGHLVANHTFTHPGLVSLAQSGGDVVEEVVRTDEIICDYVSSKVTFFRPPYGNWRDQEDGRDRPTSIVAAALNRSGQLQHYVGPVNWDISGADYDFWKRGDSARECVRAYLNRIEQRQSGIVLMHDSSEDPAVRRNNRALDLTRLLVAALRPKGYRFLRLDAVPQVVEAIALSRRGGGV